MSTETFTMTESKYKFMVSNYNDLNRRLKILEDHIGLPPDYIPPSRLFEPKKPQTDDFIDHVVNLIDFEDKLDDTMWKMLEVIGTTGLARYPDIERHISEQTPDFVENRLRRAAKSLTEMNVLTLTKLKLSLTPTVNLYSLAEIGNRLYRKRFQVKPVDSEMLKIIKEHDNLEHGYGILELGQLLANSGKYKEVHAFNRAQPEKFSDGTQYIPDIYCTAHEGTLKTYFEYERGFHTQKDFNRKCDKMCNVTRYLNFVAPNRRDLIRRLYPLVKGWVKEKGQCDESNIIVRLTTPKELQKCSLSDESWLIVFKLRKSIDPIICKVEVPEY